VQRQVRSAPGVPKPLCLLPWPHPMSTLMYTANCDLCMAYASSAQSTSELKRLVKLGSTEAVRVLGRRGIYWRRPPSTFVGWGR